MPKWRNFAKSGHTAYEVSEFFWLYVPDFSLYSFLFYQAWSSLPTGRMWTAGSTYLVYCCVHNIPNIDTMTVIQNLLKNWANLVDNLLLILSCLKKPPNCWEPDLTITNWLDVAQANLKRKLNLKLDFL